MEGLVNAPAKIYIYIYLSLNLKGLESTLREFENHYNNPGSFYRVGSYLKTREFSDLVSERSGVFTKNVIIITNMSDKEHQEISIYLDDSGVFSLNSGHDYFIYAGYLFLDNHERIAARERFKTMSREIKSSLGISMGSELKAAGLEIKYKRSLYNCVKSFNSLSATVKLSDVNESIIANKLSIHRYKDYVLKRMIKSKLEKLIASGKIDADKPVSLRVYIDQQHTSTNGYYKLSDSIREELIHGIRNFDYGMFYPPILFADFKISIKFCDSSLDYLVQASDILANRLWYGRNFNHPKLYTNIPYHNDILLP